MTTPKKSPIEIEIVNEIRLRLLERKRSKKWLAHMLDMDYGKVKRILSDTSTQQLSLSVADEMLTLLDSNLRETISISVIKSLHQEIELSFEKYNISYN